MADLEFTNEKGKFKITGTIEELQKFLGFNNHNGNGSFPQPSIAQHPLQQRVSSEPDYAGFKKKLTGKAKQFVFILSQNPKGISADHLASELGFTSGVQLGGMAGGGLAKHALDCDINLDDVYLREKTFVNGERRVIYRPGKDLPRLL
jgi:hypothetical protein